MYIDNPTCKCRHSKVQNATFFNAWLNFTDFYTTTSDSMMDAASTHTNCNGLHSTIKCIIQQVKFCQLLNKFEPKFSLPFGFSMNNAQKWKLTTLLSVVELDWWASQTHAQPEKHKNRGAQCDLSELKYGVKTWPFFKVPFYKEVFRGNFSNFHKCSKKILFWSVIGCKFLVLGSN